MVTARRKAYLTEPGQRLILTSDLLTYAEKVQQFQEESWLGDGDFVTHPLVTVPLPRAVRDDNENLLRWEGLNPALAWHPIFWLPKSIALRYRLQLPDGVKTIESDAEWTLRVGLELNASGLYDTDTGTWIDVLSLFGIDTDDPEDQARITAWLAGGHDATLDAVSIDAFFEDDEQDPHWALALVDEMRDPALHAQWAASAESIIQTVDATMADPEAERQSACAVVVSLGMLAFTDLPESPEVGNPLVELSNLWMQVSENIETVDAVDVFTKVRLICMRVVETYGFALEDLFPISDDSAAQ